MNPDAAKPAARPAALPTDRNRAVQAIAAEALAVLRTGRQIEPFSARLDGLDLQLAYGAANLVRAARVEAGERPVGRKIGFTNRSIWAEYGVWAPIWGEMYDRTVADVPARGATLELAGLAEPRIEPEIVFGIRRAPEPGMDEAALLGCIEWVAHGFEIVQSIFPGWRFAAADTVAAFGLHGALRIGPRHAVAGHEAAWLAQLTSFEIELSCDGLSVDRGRGANVLDGPLSALRHLVAELATDPLHRPLAAGEIVTTGTLTRAFPIAPGQTWRTQLAGIVLDPLELRLA